MTNHVNPRAMKKAAQAAGLLARAAKLMREAARISEENSASGHYDFLHWAIAIEELISSDHGEAGIGPTLQKMAEGAARPEVKTYEHRRADGTIVRVTIPENDR